MERGRRWLHGRSPRKASAWRFYVDTVGFKLDVDYSPNGAFCFARLTAPGSTPRTDYASFADFSDPDGNRWVQQERGYQHR
jgi:hypothetical protein